MRLGRFVPVTVLAALVLALCALYARMDGGGAPTSALPLTPSYSGMDVEVINPKTSGTPTAAVNPVIDIDIGVYDADKRRVSAMALEEYLVGVIAAEMPADYPAEALKAQAVAARTYVLEQSRQSGGSGCSKDKNADVCTDSEHCQAYMDEDARRKRWGGRFDEYETAIRTAARDTRGLIATYEGAPILALFHASSGGRTEDAAAAFSQSLPYLKAVDSGGEEGYKNYASTVTFTKAEFVKLVNKAYPKAALKSGTLSKQIKVSKLTASGRVDTLKLGDVSITGRQARKLFGLNSTDFSIKAGDEVIIACKGYGHGVGMSQAGARALALEGAGWEAIIKHYYTGVNVEHWAGVMGR